MQTFESLNASQRQQRPGVFDGSGDRKRRFHIAATRAPAVIANFHKKLQRTFEPSRARGRRESLNTRD